MICMGIERLWLALLQLEMQQNGKPTEASFVRIFLALSLDIYI